MCACAVSIKNVGFFADLELWQRRQNCAHVNKDAPVLHLLKKCLCAQSFRFADPELWRAQQDL
jgi:hypothetical protein